jgi:hypothetical protein
MSGAFDRDDHPGRPRILFVGWAHSTHTHAWIDLLRGAFNVRLYALPLGFPPPDWPVRTHVTQSTGQALDPRTRRKLYPFNKADLVVRNWLTRRIFGPGTDAPRHGLAKVIADWRPDVVHCLGLDPAGFFAAQVQERFTLRHKAAWVLQLRGGSDFFDNDREPLRPRLRHTLAQWDHLLSDNLQNVEIAAALGVPAERFAPLVPVPGTGGVDVPGLSRTWQGPPSSRRDVLWPKAYECQYSKALPVFEALRLCADTLMGRTIHMLAADETARGAHAHLPAALRERCVLHPRLQRDKVLRLLAGARLMLAPSLVDGVPNSFYEAMALGAVPVLSPLESIRCVAHEGRHALFADNLRPEQIASALTRGLKDDALADAIATNNLEHVAQIADRTALAEKIRHWYETII